jgi:hypothetical protein
MQITYNDGRTEIIEPSDFAETAKSESYWGAFHKMQIAKCYKALRDDKEMP